MIRSAQKIFILLLLYIYFCKHVPTMEHNYGI